VRFQSKEISEKEAMKLARKQSFFKNFHLIHLPDQTG
jgi:hypothetical protein